MAIRKIIWSKQASQELNNVLNFYAQRNGNVKYSEKLLSEVEDVLQILSKSELIGRLTSNKITRVISKDVYLIFYEVTEENIHIISFWDNRQDPKKKKIK